MKKPNLDYHLKFYQQNIYDEQLQVVTEVRVLDPDTKYGRSDAWEGRAYKSVSGFVDNAKDYATFMVAMTNVKCGGVYFTPNLVDPALIARAANRMKAGQKNLLTGDKNIVQIRYVLIDLDPVRPSGISSTEVELGQAVERQGAMMEYIKQDFGNFNHTLGQSGNGCHIMLRLRPQPNTPDAVNIIQDILAVLAAKFSDSAVDIDLTVFNPSRIWRCPGTMNRKGDHTTERPHRWARVDFDDSIPDKPYSLQSLKMIARMSPKFDETRSRSPRPPPPEYQPPKPAGDGPRLDLAKFMQHYSPDYFLDRDKNGKELYKFKECPQNPDHTDFKCWVGQMDNGALYHGSHHKGSCILGGEGWKLDKAVLAGSDSLRPFMKNMSTAPKPTPRQMEQAQSNVEQITERMKKVMSEPKPSENDVVPAQQMSFYNFGVPGKTPGTLRFSAQEAALYLAEYFHPIKCTSGIWRQYEDGVFKQLPKSIIEQVMSVALGSETSPNYVNAAMETLANYVNLPENSWPTNHRYLNLKNGMLDLDLLLAGAKPKDEGLFIPHNPKYESRIQLAASYDPDADTDGWCGFVQSIFPGKHEEGKRRLLQQIFGYVLHIENPIEKAVMLFGSGANGKSVCTTALSKMVGEDNTSSLSLFDLGERFKPIGLLDKILNVAAENPDRKALETDIFKKAVSHERIAGERKYGETFDFNPVCKFVFSFNSMPIITDKSYAFTRRLLILEYSQRFEGKDADLDLKTKKLDEWTDAILLWSLAGLQDLMTTREFYEDETTRGEKSEFVATLNPALRFIEENLDMSDAEGWEYSQTIYNHYCKDCKRNGLRSMSQQNFNEQIKINFPKIEKDKDPGTRRMIFRGCTLDPVEPEDARQQDVPDE